MSQNLIESIRSQAGLSEAKGLTESAGRSIARKLATIGAGALDGAAKKMGLKLSPGQLGKIFQATMAAVMQELPAAAGRSVGTFREGVDTELEADLVEDVRQAAGLIEAMASHNKEGLKFTIQTASGKKYTGMVQGSGGTIKELKRLKAAIRMATDGQDFEDRLNIYSPKPLHVKVYRGSDTGYGSKFDVVNLAGAKILAAK